MLNRELEEGSNNTNTTHIDVRQFTLFTCINNNYCFLKKISHFQTTAIFETLDNILSDNNHISYQILQSVGVGSEAVLYTTEAYGLYAARELKQSLSVAGRERSVHLTGENLCEKI